MIPDQRRECNWYVTEVFANEGEWLLNLPWRKETYSVALQQIIMGRYEQIKIYPLPIQRTDYYYK